MQRNSSRTLHSLSIYKKEHNNTDTIFLVLHSLQAKENNIDLNIVLRVKVSALRREGLFLVYYPREMNSLPCTCINPSTVKISSPFVDSMMLELSFY